MVPELLQTLSLARRCRQPLNSPCCRLRLSRGAGSADAARNTLPRLTTTCHHLTPSSPSARDKRLAVPARPAACLYPRDDQPNISRINAFDPVDLDCYPAYPQARCHQLTLRAGETIFIPSGWWHRTEVPSTSIAVTWNLVNRSNWGPFVEDCYFSRDGGRSFRGQARRLRLKAVGTLLALGERVKPGSPGTR